MLRPKLLKACRSKSCLSLVLVKNYCNNNSASRSDHNNSLQFHLLFDTCKYYWTLRVWQSFGYSKSLKTLTPGHSGKGRKYL